MQNNDNIKITMTWGDFKQVWFHLEDNPQIVHDILKPILDDKVNRLLKHDLYTTYKTASDPVEREKARVEYLDKLGIPPDFRW